MYEDRTVTGHSKGSNGAGLHLYVRSPALFLKALYQVKFNKAETDVIADPPSQTHDVLYIIQAEAVPDHHRVQGQ